MIVRARVLTLGAALGTWLALAPATASAAPSAAPDAKVRVHVDTDFFGFSHFNPDDNDDDDSNLNVVGFGVGRPSFIDGGLIAARPVLTFGIGALLLNNHAVLGARVAFVVDGVLQGNDNNTIVAGRLVPYFNYMFNPSGRFRPYIGARFGFGGGASTYENVNEEGEVTGRGTNHTIYPIVGLQGGVHIFLVERVSLDAGLAFDYAAPHSRGVVREPPPPPEADEDDFDKDGDAINVAVTLGLSAWF